MWRIDLNLNYLQTKLFFITFFCLFAIAALCPGRTSASWGTTEEKFFNFADQYIQIEAGMFTAESKNVSGIEVSLTPKPGWKLLAGNSSSIKPLRVKFSPSKCLKLKSSMQYSPPDLSGTDDSGAYSEYYTKTAYIRQEFSRLKCTQKNGFDGVATVTYLLCQNNRCVGPFSKEIRFKALGPR